MESIILYGSRYGATRRYALALSERTGIPACSYRDKPNLSDKKIIVYLGGLYAGGVLGLAKTLRHFSLQPGQTLLIATVGLADPGDPATRANLRASLQRQLPPGLLEQAVPGAAQQARRDPAGGRPGADRDLRQAGGFYRPPDDDPDGGGDPQADGRSRAVNGAGCRLPCQPPGPKQSETDPRRKRRSFLWGSVFAL